ncbi:MAG: RNA polymerase subunit sigma [Planctomycetes bacterium]|nr:RNA polymerase subunit sigma [Planctomycetota bacterium]
MQTLAMSDSDPRTISSLLAEVQAGRPGAREELFSLLYAELHLRARAAMGRRPPTGTMQATVLVHEAFLKMNSGSWNDRKHFLLAASQVMRHVLVDYRRGRRAGRGGNEFLEEVAQDFEDRAGDIEALQVALERLRESDPVMVQAVELRFYAGVDEAEVARMLDLPLRTYQRRWAETRKKLFEAVR